MSLEKQLKSLQQDLAQIDLITRPHRQSNSGFLELLIMELENIKIKMYQERGHAMPHIHIDYGKQHHIASFSISPPTRLEGCLNRKYDNKIIDWLSMNHELLLEIWEKTQSGGNPKDLVVELSGST